MRRIEPKTPLTKFYAYMYKRTEIPTTGFSVLFYSTQIWLSGSISVHNNIFLHLHMSVLEQMCFFITCYLDISEHDLPVVKRSSCSSSTIDTCKSDSLVKNRYIRWMILKQKFRYNTIIVICKISRFPFYHYYHTNQREFHTSSDKPPPETYRYPDQFICVCYASHYIYPLKAAGNNCRSPPQFRSLNHS